MSKYQKFNLPLSKFSNRQPWSWYHEPEFFQGYRLDFGYLKTNSIRNKFKNFTEITNKKIAENQTGWFVSHFTIWIWSILFTISSRNGQTKWWTFSLHEVINSFKITFLWKYLWFYTNYFIWDQSDARQMVLLWQHSERIDVFWSTQVIDIRK